VATIGPIVIAPLTFRVATPITISMSTKPTPVFGAPAARRDRTLRWTCAGRRLRVDCTAAVVLGAAAVVTGSFLAGGLLLVVFVPLLAWTAGLAADQAAIVAQEQAQAAERLLAQLEPDLAGIVKQRLGHEPAAPCWDDSQSIAPPA
jgi:hypothetical protein